MAKKASTPKDRWKNRRVMAWLCLAAGLTYPLLMLFTLNEASLKPEARERITKLSGILLIMSELNLRIEGHTDSTGSDEHNQRLSERRAGSVKDLLASQGIDMNRMVAVGYGEQRPMVDNSSKSGRQQNRRVEIVISEGTVREAAAP